MHTCSLGRFTSLAATIAGLAAAHAQNITLDNVVANDGPGFQELIFTQFGSSPIGPMHAYNFSFGVSSGTGAGASLVGGYYMGFCVNTFLTDPANGDVMLVDDTGDALSYSVNGSADVWNIGTSLKYAAIKDVLYAYEPLFSSTATTSQAFLDMSAAFSILSSELAIDYDGTLGSIDPTSGNNLVTDAFGNPISGAVATYYSSMLAEVGTGNGAGFQLHSAGWPGSDPAAGTQDMVFFAIPEPTVLSLAPLAGILALRRRRKDV